MFRVTWLSRKRRVSSNLTPGAMIRTIIFDLGGVYFTDGSKLAVGIISEKYNIPEEKVSAVINSPTGIGIDYRTGKITAHEFWKKAKEIWGAIIDEKEVAQIWHDAYKPIPRMPELIDELREKGYRLIFLANLPKERGDYLDKKYKFIGKFHDGVFSYTAKARKPDPKIYELALEKASNPAEECLFIDDKHHYLKPAEEFGIKTILFENPKKLREDLKKIGVLTQ